MPNVKLTQSLKSEYERLYATCEIKESRFDDVDRIADQLLAHQSRYASVASAVGAPWFFVAAIHNLEASQRFDRHLHNGDRLTSRTVHVPAGRPDEGDPPFTWEESARDALQIKSLDRVEEWSLPRILYELERYNGWGYRLYHPHVKSPYLWSFSAHYTSGKYVADGTWSDTATSRQCGAATLIRRLEERGDIDPQVGETPEVPILRYASEVIPYGEELQRFLNTIEGIALRVDGWPGRRTSDAVERVFGFRLHGDPQD